MENVRTQIASITGIRWMTMTMKRRRIEIWNSNYMEWLRWIERYGNDVADYLLAHNVHEVYGDWNSYYELGESYFWNVLFCDIKRDTAEYISEFMDFEKLGRDKAKDYKVFEKKNGEVLILNYKI